MQEGGLFEIIRDSYGSSDLEFRASWEQRSPGRYRVMRDESHADVQYYPIDVGTEWEVVRCREGWLPVLAALVTAALPLRLVCFAGRLCPGAE